MDTARTLGHSVSLATHAVGVALVGISPLIFPSRLPEPPGSLATPLPQVSLSLGGGSAAGGGGGSGAHRLPRPSRASHLAVPSGTPVLVPETTLDLGRGTGIPGVPDGPPGAVGFCLFGCGPENELGASVVVDPPAKATGPVRIRQGGDLRPPRKVRDVAPVYPPLAIAARVQGQVTLDCVIAEDGRVTEVSVLSGHPLLDGAAVEAVRRWRYTPTLLNGVPVSVILTVTVDFHLR